MNTIDIYLSNTVFISLWHIFTSYFQKTLILRLIFWHSPLGIYIKIQYIHYDEILDSEIYACVCKWLAHWKSPQCWAWGQEEKRTSEDERVEQHHGCNKHELGQTSGDGGEQRGLACCRPWGGKESDTTGWLNNNTG